MVIDTFLFNSLVGEQYYD